MTSLGVESLVDLLRLWQRVPAAGRQAQIEEWTEEAVRTIMGRYTLSAQLGLAYYRLVRALATGTTIADPDTPEPQQVNLAKLRVEFAQLADPRLNDQDRAYVREAGRQNGAQRAPEAPALPPRGEESTGSDSGKLEVPTAGGNDPIRVEVLDNFAARRKAAREAAELEARDNVTNLGPKLRSSKLDKIRAEHEKQIARANARRPAPTLDDLDMKSVEAEAQAGYRMASAGQRIAQNGARSTVWAAQDNDPKCIGWVRVSRTGTPCGWCAMLISRGPQSKTGIYKSKSSAEYSDGDLYHDNCNCYAVPVFSKKDYKNNPLFALNREYAELWPIVTNGTSQYDKPTDAGLTKWRRYFRRRNAQAA